jgi:signal transduction histidine kinase
VLDEKGEVLFATQMNAGPPLPLPGDPAEFIRKNASPIGGHFFAESRDGLLEVWSEPVGLTAKQAPRGWLLVARLWNARFLASLGRLAEASMHLVPLDALPAMEHTQTQLLLPLKNLAGEPLRQLQVGFPQPDFAESLARDTLAARLFVLFGLLVIVTVWLGVQKWVLRPLGLISASLAQGDAAIIRSLSHEKTELGRVAQLVESSFAQKAVIQREIGERKRAEAELRESEELVRRSLELRARLARDLHDGVIQSIYATGLGLESAMSQLGHDEPGARTRLQHCRQSLNGIIREVRSFISGLEPEERSLNDFAEELAALAHSMQVLWPVRIALQINPQIARQLNAGQEVHALQIVRECISNALRHGGAKEVRISLDQAASAAMLTVRDDGCGFDPEKSAGQGSGLLNFASRAREMGGALRLDSQAGRGTAVIVTFPVTQSPS